MERKASCLSVFLCAVTAGRKKRYFFRRAVLVDREGAETGNREAPADIYGVRTSKAVDWRSAVKLFLQRGPGAGREPGRLYSFLAVRNIVSQGVFRRREHGKREAKGRRFAGAQNIVCIRARLRSWKEEKAPGKRERRS